ncbi:MAG: hypothetical protein ABI562_01580 [Chloroflexota bacterium]
MRTRGARPPSRAARGIGLGLAGLLLLALAPTPAPVAAVAQGYTLDLGARSDFVAQTNLVQCVGASMQMMLNMMAAGADRTAATQSRLQRLARARSGARPDGRERLGASVVGWSAGLNLLGAGPYEVVGAWTIDQALLIAARAIRTTGKPVGLLMWRGRHAWVMSGFRATGDPLIPGARVTEAIVEDPLYPRDSSVWGDSPAPGAKLTIKQLGRQYVPRRSSWSMSQLDGQYVLVIPSRIDPRLLRHAAI